jgi:hypothetical protein
LAQGLNMKVVVICAAVMAAFIGLGWVAKQEEAPTLAIVLWIFALLAIAVSFYRLRMHNRLWYAGFELFFSLVGSYFVFQNLYQKLPTLTLEIAVSRMVLMFATVYVMISALSNIGEGLHSSWRFTKLWHRLFHK